MQIIAFATPMQPEWRWRIVNYAGETVEESSERFPTIGAALVTGTQRLKRLDIVDTSVRVPPYRSTRHLRGR